MVQDYSVEEQLRLANLQLQELQRQVAVLMQGGNQVTASEAGAGAKWEAGGFQGDMQNTVGLKGEDTQPLEAPAYTRLNALEQYGEPGQVPPLQTLKIGPDGCTPDRWDEWGRLMPYEGLPT